MTEIRSDDGSALRVPAPVPLPPRVILFDGVCAVCDAGVLWVVDHDPEARFAFAPLQGPTAEGVRARHPELPANLDSIVLVERGHDGVERLWWHSDAIFRIAAGLPGAWRWISVLRFVPRVLRDAGYRAFAAVRYRVFGKVEACRLATESEAARLLP